LEPDCNGRDWCVIIIYKRDSEIKNAEDFLEEYAGYADGIAAR